MLSVNLVEDTSYQLKHKTFGIQSSSQIVAFLFLITEIWLVSKGGSCRSNHGVWGIPIFCLGHRHDLDDSCSSIRFILAQELTAFAYHNALYISQTTFLRNQYNPLRKPPYRQNTEIHWTDREEHKPTRHFPSKHYKPKSVVRTSNFRSLACKILKINIL